jgi:hypothetical protein
MIPVRRPASQLRASGAPPPASQGDEGITGREKRPRAYTATHAMAATTPAEKKRKGDEAQALPPEHVRARGHGDWATLPPRRRVVQSPSDPYGLSHVSLEFDESAELE